MWDDPVKLVPVTEVNYELAQTIMRNIVANKKQMMTEAALVDLGDEQLKEWLGYQYQAWSNLEKEKKNDPELARLKHVAKTYEDEMFSEEIKDIKARIKAGRALCEARGIRYKLPEVK